MARVYAVTNEHGNRIFGCNDQHIDDVTSKRTDFWNKDVDVKKCASTKLGDLCSVSGDSYNLIYRYLVDKGINLREDCLWGHVPCSNVKVVFIKNMEIRSDAHRILEKQRW